MKSFIFIGGDMRSLYAAQRLGMRYDCLVYGVEPPEMPAGIHRSENPVLCDNAVLPLPASMDGETVYCPYPAEGMPPIGFNVLKKSVKKGGTVFTSRSFPLLEQVCAESGLELVNYFEREELAVLNAVATAEGALEIAIRELPFTLFRSKVLITGFGRIGKTLARSLTALGAQVSAACRKYSDLAWAEIYGCKPVPLLTAGALESELPKADLIINTIPAAVFDRKRLMLIRRETLVLELASVPGIADASLAEQTGVRMIWARSLPGKTAPVTAGAIIADTLENILMERSIPDGTEG